MTPERLIQVILTVPYQRGGHDLSGLDCWGVVEVWHRELLGLELNDRVRARAPTPRGLARAFSTRESWIGVDGPEDGAVAVMRTILGAVVLEAGHVGIVWKGRVLHSAEGVGPALVPLESLKDRVSGYYVHRDKHRGDLLRSASQPESVNPRGHDRPGDGG